MAPKGLKETVFYTADQVNRSLESLGSPGDLDEARVMLAARSFARILSNPGVWTVTASDDHGRPCVIVEREGDN